MFNMKEYLQKELQNFKLNEVQKDLISQTINNIRPEIWRNNESKMLAANSKTFIKLIYSISKEFPSQLGKRIFGDYNDTEITVEDEPYPAICECNVGSSFSCPSSDYPLVIKDWCDEF